MAVYERLGDVRSAAVTWGKVADVLFQRGELEEASALHERRLQACRQLGDIDCVAAALWSLAQVELARKDSGLDSREGGGVSLSHRPPGQPGSFACAKCLDWKHA